MRPSCPDQNVPLPRDLALGTAARRLRRTGLAARQRVAVGTLVCQQSRPQIGQDPGSGRVGQNVVLFGRVVRQIEELAAEDLGTMRPRLDSSGAGLRPSIGA